ncbi:helix-turn-helix transcriptional regulator [Virgibacillus halodenitrificans]|uniref:helix-turn-helix domain-containing protein n=1 Tax=Virgibacillus halodenitrificans TaxID=1482 RepID=UPI0024BFD2BE|nr:helix-turn-helix transcriptional regulator [Virgibacillus halodenitrificans]WHX25649.1 helix-turn-helix transcriptional regulator [Virgibacillus halodenitrificans]
MEEREFKSLLGEQLRLYRKQKGMTIEEAAWEAKIDAKHLGKVENGQRSMRAETLFKMVYTLDIPADFFEILKYYYQSRH